MGAFEVFHRYMGTGLIMIWYLICLIFLYLKEERKQMRVMILYLPLLVLLLFFNPLFYYFYDRFMGGETSFRVLWLLPVTVTLAATAADLVRRAEGRRAFRCPTWRL